MPYRVEWKYCPACGGQELAHDHGKAVRCGGCGFVYYQNMAAAVAGILEYEGQIIAAVRGKEPSKGMLDLPGGFIDWGETAEAALRREVKEELNLELGSVRFLTTAANSYLYKGVLYPVLDVAFVCPVSSLEGIEARDDVAEYRLLRPEEVELEAFAFVSSRAALARYLAEIGVE